MHSLTPAAHSHAQRAHIQGLLLLQSKYLISAKMPLNAN